MSGVTPTAMWLGDYRIIYRIDDRVTVVAIEHRADVYR
ncbi:MAG: type II toxin-antitoxin system RelE/ParE family toxin [Actinobacteria bacterium]|nr:type II toxin-antitoxin system RelE/ParE family toxin [Actinomycetota bacterium]